MKVRRSVSLTKELDDVILHVLKEVHMSYSQYIETRLRMNEEIARKMRLNTPSYPFK